MAVAGGVTSSAGGSAPEDGRAPGSRDRRDTGVSSAGEESSPWGGGVRAVTVALPAAGQPAMPLCLLSLILKHCVKMNIFFSCALLSFCVYFSGSWAFFFSFFIKSVQAPNFLCSLWTEV